MFRPFRRMVNLPHVVEVGPWKAWLELELWSELCEYLFRSCSSPISDSFKEESEIGFKVRINFLVYRF